MTRTQACNLARGAPWGDWMPVILPMAGTRGRSVVAGAGQLAQLLHAVRGLQRTHGARLGAHHERVRAGTTVLVADAAQKVVQQQHPVEVVAGFDGGPALVVVPRPQLALELAAQALECGGREHALG